MSLQLVAVPRGSTKLSLCTKPSKYWTCHWTCSLEIFAWNSSGTHGLPLEVKCSREIAVQKELYFKAFETSSIIMKERDYMNIKEFRNCSLLLFFVSAWQPLSSIRLGPAFSHSKAAHKGFQRETLTVENVRDAVRRQNKAKRHSRTLRGSYNLKGSTLVEIECCVFWHRSIGT